MKITNLLKTIWKILSKREEFDPEEIALKRKIIETYCNGREWLGEECRGAYVGMAACPLYYKIPWGDNCHMTDEEVNYSYWSLYGNKDPKKVELGLGLKQRF
jgi:hypothetical protein